MNYIHALLALTKLGASDGLANSPQMINRLFEPSIAVVLIWYVTNSSQLHVVL